MEKHAALRRFVKLLLACRLDSHRDSDVPDATLTEFIGQTHLQWHGVNLNEPDWGTHSHSLATTAWALRLRAMLHWMVNAYWEPLTFAAARSRRLPGLVAAVGGHVA